MTAFSLTEPRYEAARQDLVRRYGTSSYNCSSFTRAMAEQFPELSRVAGFYLAPDDTPMGEHWWLVDRQGRIVDPTADQFPCEGKGRYVRYDPKLHKVPKGKCMGCGLSLYSRTGHYPCSRSCDEMMAQEYGVRLAGGPYEEDMDFSCDAELSEKYGIDIPMPFQDKGS